MCSPARCARCWLRDRLRCGRGTGGLGAAQEDRCVLLGAVACVRDYSWAFEIVNTARDDADEIGSGSDGSRQGGGLV